jgi:hypothetical protein
MSHVAISKMDKQIANNSKISHEKCFNFGVDER